MADPEKAAFSKLRQKIDRSLIVLFLLAVSSGAASWIVLGRDAVVSSLATDVAMFIDMAPKLAVALLVASLIQLLVPRKLVAKWIGDGSGARIRTH